MRRWCGVNGRKPNKYYLGVTVCSEWINDYPKFESWCLANGWSKGLFVIRKDKAADFSPSNCLIVTLEVANGYRRCVRRIDDGRSVRDIIGRTNLGRDAAYHNRVASRIFESRWDVESAICKPVVRKS